MQTENIRSEGEKLIEEYFTEEGINFEPEVKIKNLKDDTIPYRKADFYLPQYKTYVEFLGRWNIKSNREKYKEKMNIYKKNNVPCVYIYPDNLGILNFILKRRLKKVLKEYNKKWELFKVNWILFQEKYLLNLIILIILFFSINHIFAKIFIALIFIYFMYQGLKVTFFE